MIVGNDLNGYFDLNNKEDVEGVYSLYTKTYSIRKTAQELNTNKESILRSFKKFSYSYLSKADASTKANTVVKNCKQKKDRAQTCLEKYGVVNPRQNKEINNKIIKTRTQKYLEKLQEKLRLAECELLDPFTRVQDKNGKFIFYSMRHKCGYTFKSDLRRDIKCPHCYHTNRFSKYEIEFKDFLRSKGVNIECNKKFGVKYELDIYCPDFNIGFELNGSYWHSVEKKGRNYHSNKTQYFLEKGIKVYQFWDYQDSDIVKSVMLSKLGLSPNVEYARKLVFYIPSTAEEKNFFNSNHLDGYTKSSFKLALSNSNNILAMISFRKTKGVWEIARYANKVGYNVCGAFSKLFKRSLKDLPEYSNTIISYCNRDVAPDPFQTVYDRNGFKFLGNTGSILKYYSKKENAIIARQQLQKHKLSNLLSSFNSDLTADENLIKNNIFPIRNSGNWKYIYNMEE